MEELLKQKDNVAEGENNKLHVTLSNTKKLFEDDIKAFDYRF